MTQQQFGDFFMPMVTQQLLDEQKLCTFMLRLCDQDKWKPVDLEEWVNTKLSSKSKKAQNNDYVNQLYK